MRHFEGRRPAIFTKNESSGEISSLKVLKANICADIFNDVARISCKYIFYSNRSAKNAMFCFPTLPERYTISSCDIHCQQHSWSTSLVEKNNVNPKKTGAIVMLDEQLSNNYNPTIFRMPFSNCPENSTITVDLSCWCNLELDCFGQYKFIFPLELGEHDLFQNNTISETMSMSLHIHASSRLLGSIWGSNSHQLQECSNSSENHFSIRVDVVWEEEARNSSEFEFHYKLQCEAIVGCVVIQEENDNPIDKGVLDNNMKSCFRFVLCADAESCTKPPEANCKRAIVS